jgi:hypothetical protein
MSLTGQSDVFPRENEGGQEARDLRRHFNGMLLMRRVAAQG